MALSVDAFVNGLVLYQSPNFYEMLETVTASRPIKLPCLVGVGEVFEIQLFDSLRTLERAFLYDAVSENFGC